MPTAYDTFDLDRALQRPGEILAQMGNQRLAMEARQGDRLGNAAMFNRQIQEQTARDGRMQQAELEQIKAREAARYASLQNATEEELRTQYMVNFPDTKPEQLEQMSSADLRRGIQRHGDEQLKEATMGVNRAITGKEQEISDIISRFDTTLTLKVDEEMALDPMFLQAIKDNTSRRGNEHAAKFADKKTDLNQIRSNVPEKNRVAFEEAVQAAQMRVASRFMDKDGQTIFPAAIQQQLQTRFADIQGLAQVRQKYLSEIRNPAILNEVLGVTPESPIYGPVPPPLYTDPDTQEKIPGIPGGATDGTPAATPDPIARAPGQPSQVPAPAGLPQPPPGSGIPGSSTGYYPPGPAAGGGMPFPSGMDLYSGTLSGLNAVGDMPAAAVGAVGGFVGGLTDTIAERINQNRFLGIPIQRGVPPLVDPGSAPLPMPQSPGAPSMASGGAQDPFAAQRLGSLYQQAYGTNDPAVLNAARMAAVAELGEPQVNEIMKRAASGDPQAREVAQKYIRAQSGTMMAPPLAQPFR